MEAFVALGSNLGDRLAALQQGIAHLHEAVGITVLAASPVYETEAHTRPPHHSQPPFLNAVVQLGTAHAPHALLMRLLAVEARCGRQREGAWSARTLDLDLLLYGARVLQTDALTLPHPRLHARRFVLQPLADLAAMRKLPHPYHATAGALLAACPDRAAIRRCPCTLTV